MIYGYVSESAQGKTKDTVKEQSKEIKQVYAKAKITSETYKELDKHPLLDELIEKCVAGDTLIVTKLDRLSLSLKDCIAYINKLRESGVSMHILNIGLIDNSASGNQVLNYIHSFRDFEISSRREWTQTQKSAARERNELTEGRPKRYTEFELYEALNMPAKLTLKQISEKTGISTSTLTRARARQKSLPIFFWGKEDFMSNFFHSPFTVNGMQYKHVEQFFQREKALLFNRIDIADKIIHADKPKDCKDLGEKIAEFDFFTWEAEKERVMFTGVLEKFSQNEELKKLLLETGNNMLAEASSNDIYWGIGCNEEDAINGAFWRGENLLGKTLMQVREILQDENRPSNAQLISSYPSKQLRAFGSMIGDLAGIPYENEMKQIQKKAKSMETIIKHKPEKNFVLFEGDNVQPSDDSVMTIAVADVLLKCVSATNLDEDQLRFDFADSMKRWYKFHKKPVFYGRDFKKLMEGKPGARTDSDRNGAAMRVSPIGWFYDDLDTVRKVARISASVSHNSPEGLKGAESVASAIYLARNSASKNDIKKYVETEFNYDLDRTVDDIRPNYLMTSEAKNSVPEAIIAFLESTNFESAIRNAVYLGGDTDTQAAIAASIAEAFYGIPDELIEPSWQIVKDKPRKKQLFGRMFVVTDEFYKRINV